MAEQKADGPKHGSWQWAVQQMGDGYVVMPSKAGWHTPVHTSVALRYGAEPERGLQAYLCGAWCPVKNRKHVEEVMASLPDTWRRLDANACSARTGTSQEFLVDGHDGHVVACICLDGKLFLNGKRVGGTVYEACDVTREEIYHTLGLWESKEDALKALSIDRTDTCPGEDQDLCEYDGVCLIEIRERKVGAFGGQGKRVATLRWDHEYDKDKDAYCWVQRKDGEDEVD